MTIIKANEFCATFALSKTKMFNVEYFSLGSNPAPRFTTSADVFNEPKTDYNISGQCQVDVLVDYKIANSFFQKWDDKHLRQLSEQEYSELIVDMDILFDKYPYLLKQSTDKSFGDIGFREQRNFSMKVYR